MHFSKYILLFFLIISCKDMSKKEKPISEPFKKSIIQKDKEIV